MKLHGAKNGHGRLDVTMYHGDVDLLNGAVAYLRSRKLQVSGASALVRLAIRRVDWSMVTQAEVSAAQKRGCVAKGKSDGGK